MRTIEALLKRPMPKPTSADPPPATMGGVSAPRNRKTAAPSGTSAEPVRRIVRMPKIVQKRGDSVAPIGQPSTIAERAKPAVSGDLPITPSHGRADAHVQHRQPGRAV